MLQPGVTLGLKKTALMLQVSMCYCLGFFRVLDGHVLCFCVVIELKMDDRMEFCDALSHVLST